jgi:hypothetical protein
MNVENQHQDVERPEEIIDDITGDLEDIQRNCAGAAAVAGQEIERYRELRPYWEMMGKTATSDPDIADLYGGTVDALSSVRDEWRSLREGITPITEKVLRNSASSDTAAAFTTSTFSMMRVREETGELAELTLPRIDRSEETRRYLKGLDPSLAENYSAIREVLYGTRSDPERGALYLTRQLFDAFFGILSPDDKVRSSACWKPKNGEDPNQVTRLERMEYAAQTHIIDPLKAKTLRAEAKHMRDIWVALNKAHARGHLDEQAARQLLREAHLIIEDWVEALQT